MILKIRCNKWYSKGISRQATQCTRNYGRCSYIYSSSSSSSVSAINGLLFGAGGSFFWKGFFAASTTFRFFLGGCLEFSPLFPSSLKSSISSVSSSPVCFLALLPLCPEVFFPPFDPLCFPLSDLCFLFLGTCSPAAAFLATFSA